MDKRVQRLRKLMGPWGHVKLRLGFSSPSSGMRDCCVTRGWSAKTLAAGVPFGFTVVTGDLFKVQSWGMVLARRWGGLS